MNGNHFFAIRSSRFPRVMLSRMRLNRTSTAVCTRFGRACIRLAIQSIVTHVRIPAMTRYITALLMSNGPGRLTQVSSLNSFCGWNSSLSRRVKPKISDDPDKREQVEADDAEQDLGPGAHGRGGFLSRGRRIKEVAK